MIIVQTSIVYSVRVDIVGFSIDGNVTTYPELTSDLDLNFTTFSYFKLLWSTYWPACSGSFVLMFAVGDKLLDTFSMF